MAVSLDVVALDKPDDVNVIVGQAHFIKTVEDLHEALAGGHRLSGSRPMLTRRVGTACCVKSATSYELAPSKGRTQADTIRPV